MIDDSVDKIVYARDLQGLFRTITETAVGVAMIPAYIPKNFLEQIVIYKNTSASPLYRLYVYDAVNLAWKYTNLT